jgi:hypothetical protein
MDGGGSAAAEQTHFSIAFLLFAFNVLYIPPALPDP